MSETSRTHPNLAQASAFTAIRNVPIEPLCLDDNTFRVRFEACPEALVDSIRTNGKSQVVRSQGLLNHQQFGSVENSNLWGGTCAV